MNIQLVTNGIRVSNAEGEVKGSIVISEDNIKIKNGEGVEKFQFSLNGEFQAAGGSVSISEDGGISTPNVAINADGSIIFSGGQFNADGSGSLASGNITWDAAGNMNAASIS